MSTYTDLNQYDSLLPKDSEKLWQHYTALQRQHRKYRWVLSFFVLGTISLTALSAWLGSQLYHLQQDGSFSQGFRNEFAPAKHLIKVEKRKFEGSPKFLDDGTEYVPEPPDDNPRPVYVGTPSREIDHEWAMLHWGRFFLITEEEAKAAWGANYKDFYAPKHGGYLATLEVMHSVHCIDHLRRAYDPDIYPPDSPVHGVIHRDHCLNHLRQMIMCSADLTPIPSRFFIGIDQNYIISDLPHTCRNWDNIRSWVSERYNGSLAVAPDEGIVLDEQALNKLHGVNDVNG